MEPIPIIVVHCGKSPYLEMCLRQAHRTNPASRIILLGDETTLCPEWAEFHCIHEPELFRDVESFYSMYRHFSSSSSAEAEKFCMARWIILRNFMHREGLTRCLAIDSDVLLFADMTREAERFAPFAMTFAHWSETQNLIHTNFVQDREALDSFVGYLMQVYRDPEQLKRAKEAGRKKNGKFRVSDMSHFYDWSIHTEFPFCFFEDFYADGIFFDSCIDFGREIRSISYFPGVFRRIKKISWLDGMPQVTDRQGRKLQVKALHYHGAQKFLMPFHMEGRSPHVQIFMAFLKAKLCSLGTKLGRRFRTKE